MQLWDGCPWAAAGCAPCRGAFGSARLTRRNRVLQSLCRAFLCASLCAFLCSDLVRADEPDHLHTENLKNPALASRREDRLQERQRLPIPLLQVRLWVHAKTFIAPVPVCPSIADFEDTTSSSFSTAFLRNGTTDAGRGHPGDTVLPCDRLFTRCAPGGSQGRSAREKPAAAGCELALCQENTGA